MIFAVNDEASSDTDGVPDCAICLQQCLHPVQLPCGHIFCFLCVKGTASRSQRCALCRRDIPPGYVFNPHLLCEADLASTSAFEDGYQWFYEGVNGWWQYDPRTSIELEQSYKNDQPWIEVLIAGFLYVIDFKNMVQMRRANPTRRRRIKRDIVTIADKKGIAGIRVAPPVQQQSSRETGDGTDMPASTLAAAGNAAVTLGGAVRQPRRRMARGNGGSLTPAVASATTRDGQQTRTALLTAGGVPVMPPGGAVRQQRPNVSLGSDGSTIPTGSNSDRNDGRQTRASSARQFRSLAGRDADGYSSLSATLNAVPSDGRQTRSSSSRQLRSHSTHDLDGSPLSATSDSTSNSQQARATPTGAASVPPGGTARQPRSYVIRNVDGSPLPAAPNNTPGDGHQSRVAPTGAMSVTPDAVARQPWSNATRNIDGGPNASSSDDYLQQTRAAPTGATTDGATIQLRSNTARDIDGSLLPVDHDATPSDGQQARASPTGTSSITPNGATAQLWSNMTRDIDGSPLPIAPNTSPADGQWANATVTQRDIRTTSLSQRDSTDLNALVEDISDLEIGDSDEDDLAVREVLGEESE